MSIDITKVGAIQLVFDTLEIVVLNLHGSEIWRRQYTTRANLDKVADKMVQTLHVEMMRREKGRT